MKAREKIFILTNVKKAILANLIPIDGVLLSRLEACGVHLDGYQSDRRNVPVKETSKVLEMKRKNPFSTNEKAA